MPFYSCWQSVGETKIFFQCCIYGLFSGSHSMMHTRTWNCREKVFWEREKGENMSLCENGRNIPSLSSSLWHAEKMKLPEKAEQSFILFTPSRFPTNLMLEFQRICSDIQKKQKKNLKSMKITPYRYCKERKEKNSGKEKESAIKCPTHSLGSLPLPPSLSHTLTHSLSLSLPLSFLSSFPQGLDPPLRLVLCA